jgi:hypothetical protein
MIKVSRFKPEPLKFNIMRLAASFIVLLFGISSTSIALASPPACARNHPGLFMLADAVIEASVIKSRRWKEGISTLHLVAKYRVNDVFKGDVKRGSVVIATFTCLDKPIPEWAIGYPGVMDYCQGGGGLHLTGVRAQDGDTVKKNGVVPNWILFLKRDIRKGAPQQTWLEVSETGFSGSGCGKNRENIFPDQQSGFDRMLERMNDLKNSSSRP